MYPPAMSKLAKQYLCVPAPMGQLNDCLALIAGNIFVQKDVI